MLTTPTETRTLSVPGMVSSEPDFAPLRDRLAALRLRTLVTLAEQPDDGSLDAGLLALVANVQTALVAVEALIEIERPRPHLGEHDGVEIAGAPCFQQGDFPP